MCLLLFLNCQLLFYPTRCNKVVQEHCHHLGISKREREEEGGGRARKGKRHSDSREQRAESREQRKNTESANESAEQRSGRLRRKRERGGWEARAQGRE